MEAGTSENEATVESIGVWVFAHLRKICVSGSSGIKSALKFIVPFYCANSRSLR